MPTRTWDVKARLLCVVLDFHQDKQCTYIVTLRCIREAIVAVEKQEVLRILTVFVTLGI
jgi:hypothetical protein